MAYQSETPTAASLEWDTEVVRLAVLDFLRTSGLLRSVSLLGLRCGLAVLPQSQELESIWLDSNTTFVSLSSAICLNSSSQKEE